MMERTVVRTSLYPAFLAPPPSLTSDQFAFRPTGSTSAAIISLLHTIASLLQTNPYVIVISLVFSKAFDTVRQSTLLSKMSELDLLVYVYNSMVSFFSGHAHRTVYNGEVSSTKSISANIVQGSSIGLASYAVTAADLRPLRAGNSLVKFADDTYLVIPATHADTRVAEPGHITAWAADNNLRLNKTKTREVVFYDNRRRHRIQPPPPLPDMTCGTTLKVLGVTFTDTLSASDHVRLVISDSAQSLYALRVLRHHGLGEAGLQTVFRAIVVSRLTYAASAWIGFITSTDNQRIEAFLHRSKRCGYCSPDLLDFVQLVEEGDERLFKRINNNSSHVLRGLLPPPSVATQQYCLRRRPHDRQMPDHTGHLADKNFLTRIIHAV